MSEATGSQTIERVVRRAADDPEFRDRALRDIGTALAQEGFIVTDSEMRLLMSFWEPICALDRRRANERIESLARSFGR